MGTKSLYQRQEGHDYWRSDLLSPAVYGCRRLFPGKISGSAPGRAGGNLSGAPVDRAQVLAKVRGALAEALEISEDDIDEESRFAEDLDADSLDLVELLLEMEREYGFKVSDEEAAEVETVRDAVDLIMNKAS